jgi:hypothetical protein
MAREAHTLLTTGDFGYFSQDLKPNGKNFSHGIATNYSDNVVLDCRKELDYGVRNFSV